MVGFFQCKGRMYVPLLWHDFYLNAETNYGYDLRTIWIYGKRALRHLGTRPRLKGTEPSACFSAWGLSFWAGEATVPWGLEGHREGEEAFSGENNTRKGGRKVTHGQGKKEGQRELATLPGAPRRRGRTQEGLRNCVEILGIVFFFFPPKDILCQNKI